MFESIYVIFFRILATRKYRFTQKKRYTYMQTQRETGMMTIGKICKADLPKIEWLEESLSFVTVYNAACIILQYTRGRTNSNRSQHACILYLPYQNPSSCITSKTTCLLIVCWIHFQFVSILYPGSGYFDVFLSSPTFIWHSVAIT